MSLRNQRFELVQSMQAKTIQPIIHALQHADSGQKICIFIPYNHGGSVQQTLLLVDAIESSRATVQIICDRYVISSAAFLWLWFLLRPVQHVSVETTDHPALLVYHRPRIDTENGQLLFADQIASQDENYQNLQSSTQIFDDLFVLLIEKLKQLYTPDQIPYHNIDGYYANQDFVLPI